MDALKLRRELGPSTGHTLSDIYATHAGLFSDHAAPANNAFSHTRDMLNGHQFFYQAFFFLFLLVLIAPLPRTSLWRRSVAAAAEMA